MYTVAFSHGKLVMRMAGCTLGALLMLFVAVRTGSAVPIVAFTFFAAVAGFSAFTIMTGRPALECDQRGITLNNLLTSQTVEWPNIASVKVHALTLYWLGFIPAARHEHLVIATTGGWLSSKKIRASTTLWALPVGGLREVLSRLEAAQPGSASTLLRPSNLPRTEAADPASSTFDPDAAIARYLTRKAEQGTAPITSTPPRPVFGRKQV